MACEKAGLDPDSALEQADSGHAAIAMSLSTKEVNSSGLVSACIIVFAVEPHP